MYTVQPNSTEMAMDSCEVTVYIQYFKPRKVVRYPRKPGNLGENHENLTKGKLWHKLFVSVGPLVSTYRTQHGLTNKSLIV